MGNGKLSPESLALRGPERLWQPAIDIPKNGEEFRSLSSERPSPFVDPDKEEAIAAASRKRQTIHQQLTEQLQQIAHKKANRRAEESAAFHNAVTPGTGLKDPFKEADKEW